MNHDRITLFTARTGGYFHHHVPGIVRTCAPNPSVIVSVEARYDRRGGQIEANSDYRDHDILIRRSDDDGLTWSPPQLVLSHTDFGPGPLHNFTMIAARDGAVHALVLHDYQTLWHLRSDDGGRTWSRPTDCTTTLHAMRDVYDCRAVGTGCGHGIELRSGRLLIAAWMSDNSHSSHRPSVVTTLYSDDRGKSWRHGEIACPTTDTIRWPSESAIVELPDCLGGQVMLNMRNESDARRRLVSVSPDGISNWSPARFVDDLPEPVCEGAMITLPDPRKQDPRPRKFDSKMPHGASAMLLAFTNPRSLEQTMCRVNGRKSDRKNLTLHISEDGGKSWPIRHVIEPGPANYSDLCALPDGQVLVVFNAGLAGNDMHDSANTFVQKIDVRPLL